MSILSKAISELTSQRHEALQLRRKPRNNDERWDIFTGIFHNRDIIYDGMIDTFSRAMDRLTKEE
ncbi:hypothetical protein CJF30_00003869 [Rutstroemia sp. NJR-2017a BBW]|nr:hypothetical protein CJF30_00003869 [Rutstroemia sp. NJR-2017a BBW]